MISGTVVSRSSHSVDIPLFDAVGCICLWEDRLLLLRRAQDRSYPGVWGLPSGKVDQGETRDRAVLREVYEETGLLRSAANINHVADFHVKNADFTFLYAVFSTTFSTQPTVSLNTAEHIEYQWFLFDETKRIDLVPGTRECLDAVRLKILPPKQLHLFSIDDHLLADALYAEQEQMEEQIAPHVVAMGRSTCAAPIVVMGPPAAGKTTAIRNILEVRPEISYHHYDVMKDEDTRQYLYLTRFLSGDRSFAFLCQMEALASRYWHAHSTQADLPLIDEWIFSTLAYSKALRYNKSLLDYEFQTFYMTYLAYLQWSPPPGLVINLTARPEVLRRRVERRGRRLEHTSHDLRYLEVLVRAFDEVADEVGTRFKVERIDSSSMTESAVLELLLRMIDDYRSQST